MPSSRTITLKPAPTKPTRAPNPRATVRDLSRSQAISVFRRPSVWQRIFELFRRPKS